MQHDVRDKCLRRIFSIYKIYYLLLNENYKGEYSFNNYNYKHSINMKYIKYFNIYIYIYIYI